MPGWLHNCEVISSSPSISIQTVDLTVHRAALPPEALSKECLPCNARLIELTALEPDIAVRAFADHASDEERCRAYRFSPARARLYVHAHGALHLLSPLPHRSLSYAAGRAWVAVAARPIGLDVVTAADDALLDRSFATPAEEMAVAAGTFPPRLAIWAAKEAAAKVTGDTRREPEGWRLVRVDSGLRVIGSPNEPVTIVPARLGRDLLAMLAFVGLDTARAAAGYI